MGLQSGSRKWGRRLEAAAWHFTIGMIATMALAPVLSVAIQLSTPKAASVGLNSRWEVSWQNLSQDDWYPTPTEGYCDASLVKQRLRLGPLEIRYSYSY